MKKIFLAFTVALLASPVLATPIDLTKYTLAWSDEFDTLSLGDALPRNGKNWYTQQFWGGGFGSATFKPSTGDVWAIGPKGDASSALEIKMLRDTSGGSLRSGLISAMWPDGTTAAGETTSRDTYTEARIWLPDAIPGVWPAFWGVEKDYLSSFGTPRSAMELDAIEAYGALVDRYTTVNHKWDFNPGLHEDGNTRTFHAPVGLYGAWHTYGVGIDSHGAITYYFDGEPYLFFGSRTSTWGSNYDTIINQPVGWMLNFAAGGGWPIDPELGLSKPASMWIDYVREYKLISTTFATDFTITPTGQDISVIPGITRTDGASGGITINANTAADANITAASGVGYSLTSTGSQAQFIQATAKSTGAAGPLICVRYTNEANWLCERWSSTVTEIVKKVNGTASVVSSLSGQTNAIGDVMRLEIDASNNARVLVNGVQKIAPTAINAPSLTSMTPGLVPRSTVKLDWIDDLSSGPLQ